MSMVSPFEGRVTAHYMGYRNHAGIDIAPPVRGTTGLAVRAAFAGWVVSVVSWSYHGSRVSTWAPGRTGNGLRIRNPDGQGQGYNHVTPAVRAGAWVEAGDVIGYNDRSGNMTGPHLHYEEWTDWADHYSHRDPRRSFSHFGVAPGSAPVLPETVRVMTEAVVAPPEVVDPLLEVLRTMHVYVFFFLDKAGTAHGVANMLQGWWTRVPTDRVDQLTTHLDRHEIPWAWHQAATKTDTPRYVATPEVLAPRGEAAWNGGVS